MTSSIAWGPVRTSVLRLAAGVFLAISAGAAAQAASMSCTTSGPGNSSATFSLASSVAASCFGGNDTNSIDQAFSMFGKDGWTLAHKNDGPDGDQAITFTTAPVNGAKSGDWAIDSFRGLTDVVITLKAGNGFGAFLLDTASLSGTWSSSKDLSHASIYYNGSPQPIPLPAAAWLLLGGLGGLGLIRRRARAA